LRTAPKQCWAARGKEPTTQAGWALTRVLFWLQYQVIQPVNGDPFVGMLETPVTSAPIVAAYLSALPAYRTGVAPLLRGVEIGLAHGFLLAGPFIKVHTAFSTSLGGAGGG
jgi:photosystem I subunit 11